MIKQTLQQNESYQLPADDSYPDEIKDGYQLNWVGKNYAKYAAGLKPVTVLEPDAEHNSLNENRQSQNVYITGDNLEVLKHLQNAYAGKVNMIYIDPPYNTGKEFVYQDEFHFSDAELAEKIGLDEKEIARVRQLNGRSSHSAWLTFIYPRLKIAARLLKPTGVIFISIDDNEQAQLKLLCDEVFGDNNFLGEIIWQTATDNNPTQVATEHEYVLVYAKRKEELDFWEIPSEKGKVIQAKYEELKQQFGTDCESIQKALRKWIGQTTNGDDLSGVAHYSYVDEKGVFYPGNSANTKPGGYTYDIHHPKTKNVCAKPEYGYRWTKETFDKAEKAGEVLWGADEKTIPKIKKRLDTATAKLKSYYYEDNRTVSGELKTLFDGKAVFTNPKSLNFLQHILRFSLPAASVSGGTAEDLSAVRERLRRKFEDMAAVLKKIPFTPANFRALFGRDGTVVTPLGKVTIGKNQFEKLKSKEREELLQAMYDTLTDPIIVIKEQRQGRGPDNLFVKSFIKDEQDTFITVMSVVAKIDGIDVSISTYQRRTYEVMQKINTPADIIYEKQHRQEVVPGGNGDNPLTLSDGNRLSILSAHSEKSQEENSPLVLDFFSGSGTTAHAVMQLNAENAGKAGGSQIRYILVQLPEETPDNSEARKAGYETIDQIGMERIKRAAKKITAAKPAGLFNAANPDFGFQHFICKTVDAQTIDKLDDFDKLQKQQTAFSKDMITPFGLETILRTWLTDDGLELTENAAELKFGNYTAYYSEKLAKLYLIDKDEAWNIESLKALLNAIGKNELTVKTLVIYAYSFSFSNLRELKTNLDTLDSKKPAVQERY